MKGHLHPGLMILKMAKFGKILRQSLRTIRRTIENTDFTVLGFEMIQSGARRSTGANQNSRS